MKLWLFTGRSTTDRLAAMTIAMVVAMVVGFACLCFSFQTNAVFTSCLCAQRKLCTHDTLSTSLDVIAVVVRSKLALNISISVFNYRIPFNLTFVDYPL